MNPSKFVCECEEHMRSACGGEAEYSDHGGKRYCVLHFPTGKSNKSFDQAVKRKTDARDYNFRGVWFPHEVRFDAFDAQADFSYATFNGEADFESTKFYQIAAFTKAIFKGSAYFAEAEFHNEAAFLFSTFESDVDFGDAKFKGVADFSEPKFIAKANFFAAAFSGAVDFSGSLFDFCSASFREGSFREASFKADANFSDASFSAAADFSRTLFSGDVWFSNTTFTAAAFYSDSRFSATAYFNWATFIANATFFCATFSEDARFFSATFNAPADFKHVRFCKDVDFGSAKFRASADFAESLIHASVRFTETSFDGSVRFFGRATEKELGDGARLAAMALGKDPSLDFQHARIEHPDRMVFHTLSLCPHWFVNVDPRQFIFTDVVWEWDRISITQAIAALEANLVSSPNRLLAIACRQLAENAETNNRYEEAARFRYWAMDLARRTKWKGWSFWKTDWLHMLYWVVSGYGERILRALAWLIGIWIVFAILYMPVGFKQGTTNTSTEQAATIVAEEPPRELWRALIYSFAVMSLQKPEPKPLTGTAQTLVLLETILGPVQAALLALAIRRKFMR